jgi:hypothetical protein
MTESMSTPGFFTSALGIYDSSNPFETEFREAEDRKKQSYYNEVNNNDSYFPSFGFSPRTSPVPDQPKVQVRQPVLQHPDLDGMDLGTPGRWNPSKQMFALDPQNFQQQAPPKSAQAPFKDWNLDPHLRHPSSLDKIMAQDINAKTKIQHGQVTPPSDRSPDSETALHDEEPQETAKNSSKSKAGGRRKRSVQVSQPTETTSSRRRKSSTTTKSVTSDAQDEGEEEMDEKRSKFLQRNRVAASKCRQKKKEWTNNLEQRARELQANKAQLAMLVGSLQEEMLFLKGEVLRHNNCDCKSMRDYLKQQVQSISQITHQHGLSSMPNFSGSPVTDSLEFDQRSQASMPSTRDGSMSISSPIEDQQLKDLLTTEIQPRQR